MAIKINLLKVYGRLLIGMWFIYRIPIFFTNNYIQYDG